MLSDKERELVSIGASIAAGCKPCTNFHLRAARIAGASNLEISRAVHNALAVRRHATEEMAQLASQHLGAPISDAEGQENPIIRELVSISAACAINSVADLEMHLAAAQTLGATKGQIISAIKIGEAVKRTAEGKVEEATGRALGAKPGEGESCCGPSEDRITEREMKRSAPAPERSAIGDCGPTCGCHSETQKKSN